MVLVNEALGYRVCLECLDVLQDGDEQAWMSQHIGDAACDTQPSVHLATRGRPHPAAGHVRGARPRLRRPARGRGRARQ
jgi:hypothetical protein